MHIQSLISYLDSIAPPDLQEQYDNAGLIVGHPDKIIHKALICLDSTDAVVEEAIERQCDLIIAHHPIIFRGLKRLNGQNYVERAVMLAIKHDIAIFAIHTNLDNVLHNGVNGRIADRVGLADRQILAPRSGDPTGETGAGITGFLPEPLEEKTFLRLVLETMSLNLLKHTPLTGRSVSKVAICGGSGSFLLADAINQGAHALISADFKYHEYFDADGRILVADIGHFESERFTMDLLLDLISEKFPNFAACLTQTNTNPIRYFIQ